MNSNEPQKLDTIEYEGIEIKVWRNPNGSITVRLPWAQFPDWSGKTTAQLIEDAKENVDMWRNSPMDSDNPLKSTPAPVVTEPRKRLVVDEHHDEIVEEIEVVEAQDEQIEIVETTDEMTKAQYKGRTIYVNTNAVNKGSHTDTNIKALPVLINFAGVELKSESVEKGLSSAKAIIDRWSKPSPFQSQA